MFVDSGELESWMCHMDEMRTFVLEFEWRRGKKSVAAAAIFYMLGDKTVELVFLATGEGRCNSSVCIHISTHQFWAPNY